MATPIPALAQAAVQEDKSTLGQVVVTASRIEQALRDAPASVSVITAKELQTKPVADVSEALAHVEGVTVARNGNQVGGIQLRGLGKAYTLILINGRRVNSTSAMFRGNDYDSGWIPADMIERIEIVRGPLSALYGSDAIGGVVNIITRRIGRSWRRSLEASYTKQQDSHAGDAWQVGASLAGPLVRDALGLQVYASRAHREADGDVNPSHLPGVPQRDDQSVSALVAWNPAAGHELDLNVDYSKRDHDHYVLDRRVYGLRYHSSLGRTEVDASASRDITHNRKGMINEQVNPNASTTEIASAHATMHLGADDQHTLAYGGEWRQERLNDPAGVVGLPGVSSPTQPEISVRQVGLFLEGSFAIAPPLALTLSNRYDRHQKFGGHHSPRAYLVWHPSADWTVKGGWARGFRAPTLLQNSPLWGSASCGGLDGCYLIGSAALKPETSRTVELGVAYDHGGINAGVTAFRNDVNDMISDDPPRTWNHADAPHFINFVGFLPEDAPGYGRPVFAYMNLGRVRTLGVEASFNVSLTRSLRLRTNYTYLKAEDRSHATILPLAHRPRHAANAALAWKVRANLEMELQTSANSGQYTYVDADPRWTTYKAGYALTDLTAAWTPSRQWSVRAGILNIADRRVARNAWFDFNEDRRRFFVSTQWTF